MQTLVLTVPAHLRFSAGIRELALEAAESAHFSQRDANLFRLIVDELFMNAVRYGSHSESVVTVRFVLDQLVITGTVEDEGHGKTRTSASDLLRIVEEEKQNDTLKKTHGRGLAQIASTLASHFSVVDRPEGGLAISFEKRSTPVVQKTDAVVVSSADFIPVGKSFQTVFVVSGEIDLVNLDAQAAPIDRFFEELVQPHIVVLDLSTLSYCNSTFVAKIAGWYTKAKMKKSELRLRGVTPAVFDILDLVGLAPLLTLNRA